MAVTNPSGPASTPELPILVFTWMTPSFKKTLKEYEDKRYDPVFTWISTVKSHPALIHPLLPLAGITNQTSPAPPAGVDVDVGIGNEIIYFSSSFTLIWQAFCIIIFVCLFFSNRKEGLIKDLMKVQDFKKL